MSVSLASEKATRRRYERTIASANFTGAASFGLVIRNFQLKCSDPQAKVSNARRSRKPNQVAWRHSRHDGADGVIGVLAGDAFEGREAFCYLHDAEIERDGNTRTFASCDQVPYLFETER